MRTFLSSLGPIFHGKKIGKMGKREKKIVGKEIRIQFISGIGNLKAKLADKDVSF